MAHLALYREWRPKTFDEIVEQKHAVYALKQSVVSGQIAHAYLFSGTRGTGKTTMAKIFSRAINCLQPIQGNPCNQCDICRTALDGSLMDIIEMDAASNNSVDNIRRICDEIVFMPSRAHYKVYIIDEVHMLSAGAFNALLKTLEEPPSHAVFILATTEAHRIPATILSRCQRYEFRRIPVDSMVTRLRQITAQAHIAIEPEALHTIAVLADGALRDAISILDQARSAFPPPVNRDQVLSLVGVVRDQFLQQVAAALVTGEIDALLQRVDQLIMDGRDLARFVTDLAQHLRNLLVCQVAADDALLVRVHTETLSDMRKLAVLIDRARLIELIRGLSALLSDLRWAPDSRTALEIGLIRLADQQQAVQPASGRPAQEKRQVPGAAQPLQPAAGLAAQAVSPGTRTAQPSNEAAASARVGSAEKIEETPLPEPPPEDTAWQGLPDETPTGVPDDAPAGKQTAEEHPVPAAVPEPAKSTKKTENASAAATGLKSLADEEASLIWQRVLDMLRDAGHMTLYLFSRPASVSLCDGIMQIRFSAEDAIHYQEVSQPGSLKIIREAVRACSGQEWPLQLLLASGEQADDSAPAAASWVDQVKMTAARLGIPVEVEE